MSEKYRIWNQHKLYFLTLTVKDWIEILIDARYKLIIIDALRFCQKEKGLEIFGYCIMSSHVHMIARVKEDCSLSDFLRDFKKHTSKLIISQLREEQDHHKRSLVPKFTTSRSGKGNYTFWQAGNHPVEISSNKFFNEKLEYIHNNPVKASLVRRPEDYLFSSARNYAGMDNYLDIVLETVRLETYK